MTAPLLAVDAPWLLYRSFFALPESITGVDDRPVGALLGSANALLRVVEQYRPRAVAVCFGAEEAAYRVQLFPGYHAAREPMPPALAWQFAAAPQMFRAFGWTVAETAELEADDLLGALAALEREAGGETLLLTGDRDMYQCVSDSVTVLHLKGADIDAVSVEQVRARYGVEPGQVPDFIALRGDPSDGLPGAPGIGAKTAAQLLARHRSLEQLLALVGTPAAPRVSGHDIRPRAAAALRDNAELLRAFREIATLQPVSVERPPDAMLDSAAAAAAVRALGMGQLAGRLESSG